jgi:hypothetical protein
MYFDYERERRLQLLQFITPIFIAISAIVFVVIGAALLAPLPPLAQSALFVSESTVEAHLTRIYRKLGLRNRAELAQQVSVASA